MTREVALWPNGRYYDISISQSVFAWHLIDRGAIASAVSINVCPYCDGNGRLYKEGFGLMRCACSLKDKAIEMGRVNTKLRVQSKYPRKTLEEFQVWGSSVQKETLKSVKSYITKWAEWPDAWVTLLGTVGTGKSHILQSIATKFGLWALYIAIGDFESSVFRWLDEGILTDAIDVVARWPILILDDVGANHAPKGNDFVKSQLRTIVDFRYRLPQEYITCVASNFTLEEFKYYDMRIADRLFDNENCTIFMNGESWRTRNV